VLAVLGASVAVWGVVFSRLAKGQPVVPYEPRQHPPRGPADILMALVLILIVLSIAILVASTSVHAATEHAPTASQASAAKDSPPTKSDQHEPKAGEAESKKAAKQRELGPEDLVNGMFRELVLLVVLVAAMRLLSRATWSDLGFSFQRLGYDAALGVCAYLAAIVPLMALQSLLAISFRQPYTHPIIEGYKHEPDAVMLSLTAVTAVVVAPLFEEVVFRVLLQGWFESLDATWQKQRQATAPVEPILPAPAPEPMPAVMTPAPAVGNNPYASPVAPVESPIAAPPAVAFVPRPALWPILASSTLFAMMHFGQGLGPVSLFFLALVLGYLYQRTHRLWPSLVVHMLLNAGTVVILWHTVASGLAVGK
jgi:membrane protease YdiL (CAAX protease family)